MKIEFTNFDTISGEYPELPTGEVGSGVEVPYDLYILTGSHNGVYEELQWIRDLEAWIRRADALKISLLGICFGHQVVASALSGKVTVNPKGWEMGAHSFALNEAGQALFKGKKALSLQYSHQDIVATLPPCMTPLGGNAITAYQAMCKDSRILTIQGHPEFCKETMQGILKRKILAGIVSEAEYQEAIRSLDDPVDDNFVACASLAYLKLHPELETAK